MAALFRLRSIYCIRQFNYFSRNVVTSTKNSRFRPRIQQTDKNQNAITMQLEHALSSEDDVEDDLLPEDGTVIDIKKSTVFVSGLRNARIGSVASLETRNGNPVNGVVLHLEKEIVTLALFGPTIEVNIGSKVFHEKDRLLIPCGKDLLGRVIDPIGNVLDGKTSLDFAQLPMKPCLAVPIPSVVSRCPIQHPLTTGIQVIDCFHPLGHGHRLGIFGKRGSGKTVLALDILTHIRNWNEKQPDDAIYCVYVAIAKNNQRLHQILSFLQSKDVLKFTTVVASVDTDPSTVQYLAPFTGSTVVEEFCQMGKRTVIIYDDLSAHEQISEELIRDTKQRALIGKSSMGLHTQLLERSGQFSEEKGGGSITALALVEIPSQESQKNGFQESITSIVDDSIQMDSDLLNRKRYPPIDILHPSHLTRGPPFQSVALWKVLQDLQKVIRDGYHISTQSKLAKDFGFEPEPEVEDCIEHREYIQNFFQQTIGNTRTPLELLLGCFVLSRSLILCKPSYLDSNQCMELWLEYFHKNCLSLKTEIENTPRNSVWSSSMEKSLNLAFMNFINSLHKE